MAEFGNQQLLPASKAAADLTAQQYHVVRLSAANATNLASLATTSAISGVLQNKPKTNEACSVAFSGASKITAGGALTANDIITTNSSGRAAVVASGQMAIGRVLEAAAADGDIVSAVLFPPVRWAGAA